MAFSNQSDAGRSSLNRYLRAGLFAGLIAAAINILIYLALVFFGGHDWAVMIVLSILLASLLPNLIAALAYFLLSKYTIIAFPVLVVGVVAFVLISILPHLGVGPAPSPALSQLPAGFELITVPLHIIFGLSAILIMPRLLSKNTNQTEQTIN